MVIKTLPAGESYIQMLPSPDGGSQLFLPFKGRIKVGMGFNAGTNEQDNSSKQPPAQLASQLDRCREKTLEDAARQADGRFEISQTASIRELYSRFRLS